MKPALLCTLLFLCGGLHAQYGTIYQFHFTLQDPETGFDSRTDSHKVQTKKQGRILLLKARNYTYEIASDHHHALSAKNGRITINYSAVPPYVDVNVSVLRQHKRTNESFNLHLIYPKDEDFGHLEWQKDSLIIDLSFDRDPFDYLLITPKTEDNNRNLSCLINDCCQPEWQLSELGLYKQAQAKTRKFQRIKQRIAYQIDSLVTSHFPNNIFHQFFEEECVTAYYHGDTTYTALNCEVPVDTNLYGLKRQYRLKSPPAGVDLQLSINKFIGQKPYFSAQYFGDKKFNASELNFVPPNEIRAFAEKEYPEVNFAQDASNLTYVGLVYLSKLPQNSYETPEPEPLVPLSIEHKTSPYWFGTFAYLMQATLPDQGKWSGVANYYFYAQKARLIVKTENYYDLTNE